MLPLMRVDLMGPMGHLGHFNIQRCLGSQQLYAAVYLCVYIHCMYVIHTAYIWHCPLVRAALPVM